MNQTKKSPGPTANHQLPSKAPVTDTRIAAALDAVPATELTDLAAPDSARRGLLAVVGIGTLFGLLLLGVLLLQQRGGAVVEERDEARVAAGETQVEYIDFATQVRRACDAGELDPGDRLCLAAREVVEQPLPTAPPEIAQDGRGIVRTNLVGNDLVILYTDGTAENIGRIVGRDGALGPTGVGVSAFAINDGRLVVTFTDGRVVDLGQVVGSAGRDGTDGADGRGIVDTDIVDGRLIIFYDDDTTEDAGPLPQVPSIQSVTRVYGDGTVERCTRSGGDDTDPVLDCVITEPTAEVPEPTESPEPPLVEIP